MVAVMEKRHITTQDANARSFFGKENAAFETQIEKIAGHDPRLLDVFRRTRDWYATEVSQSRK